MQRDDVYLLDILQAAELAVEYLRDTKQDDFYSDTEKQDAVIRRLEIIGEAAGRISDQTKAKTRDIPWSK